MQSRAEIHFRDIYRSRFDQRFCQRRDFLPRLEQNSDGTRQPVPQIAENPRRAVKHCHVPVVSAGVHHPRMCRDMIRCIFLRNGKRVDIGAESHVASGTAVIQERHDIRFQKRIEHFQGQGFQTFPQEGGGFELLSRNFRYFVQFMPQGGRFFQMPAGEFQNFFFHFSIPYDKLRLCAKSQSSPLSSAKNGSHTL